MMRTNKVFWLTISVCAVIVCWAGSRSLGDTANFVVLPSGENDYSGKSYNSIGAWYDEKWQASSFFLLKEKSSGPGPGPSSDEYQYERTSAPVTDTAGKDSVYHASKTDSSSIPMDLVVTSWRVTGHVHFASGM
jgi:hypothetical protein